MLTSLFLSHSLVLEFGVMKTVDLCENGRNIPLTQANKQEFVRLYTKYLLEDSIAAQFEAFRYGGGDVRGWNAEWEFV